MSLSGTTSGSATIGSLGWNKEDVARAATNVSPSLDIPFGFFLYAFVAASVFAVTLPFFSNEVLLQHHYNQRSVAFTHLLTLGWIGSVVLGATFQLVPVALNVKLHSERLARWAFWFHLIGVTGMVASLWIWNFRILLWFGVALTLSFGLYVYNIGRTLKRVRRQDAVSVHIVASLVYLTLTFLAGQYLMHDKVTPFSPFHVLSAIHAHAHLGAMGWLIMLIVGVSYRLLPMFSLSRIQSRRRIWISFVLLNIGTLGVFGGLLNRSPWLPMAALTSGTGLGIWVWECEAILKAGNRHHLDGTLRMVRIALWHVPLIAALGFWLSLPEAEPSLFKSQVQTAYGLLALLAVVGLFTVAMLYKIVPFLVWYRIYPPLVGRQPVPKLYDLYSLRIQHWSLRFFLTGTWSTAVLSAFGERSPKSALYLATAMLGTGVLMMVANMMIAISRLITEPASPHTWFETLPDRPCSPNASPAERTTP